MNTLQHKTRRPAISLGATALAATLFAAALAPHAHAATSTASPAVTAQPATAAVKQGAATDAKADTQAHAIDESLLRFSRDGQDAIDNVRLARVDLFEGKTDLAMQDMKAAQKALAAAKVEAPSFATTTKVKIQGKTVGTDKDTVKADVVPIDGDLVVSDLALMTPKHQGFLAKARTFLHLGDKASAVKALREGEIDVAYQRKWLVIPDAGRQLEQAVALASKGKYYEANLALKALEDGIQTDTVSFGAPDAHPAS